MKYEKYIWGRSLGKIDSPRINTNCTNFTNAGENKR